MPKLSKRVFQSRAVEKGLNVSEYMAKGAVPPELLGIHGNGGFSAIAHRSQQLKEIDNLVNNAVSDELYFTVRDKNGVVTTPFMHNGQLMRPNAKGEVRITDKGKIQLAMKIDAYRKKRVDDIMEKVRLGDDIACYLFGISLSNWQTLCSKTVTKGILDSYGIKMHPDLMKLDCTIEYIESLPPSLTQTQSVSKLWRICEAFEKNVNQDDLTTLSDTMKNMKDGHNNPSNINEEGHPFRGEVEATKKYATTGKQQTVVEYPDP